MRLNSIHRTTLVTRRSPQTQTQKHQHNRRAAYVAGVWRFRSGSLSAPSAYRSKSNRDFSIHTAHHSHTVAHDARTVARFAYSCTAGDDTNHNHPICTPLCASTNAPHRGCHSICTHTQKHTHQQEPLLQILPLYTRPSVHDSRAGLGMLGVTPTRRVLLEVLACPRASQHRTRKRPASTAQRGPPAAHVTFMRQTERRMRDWPLRRRHGYPMHQSFAASPARSAPSPPSPIAPPTVSPRAW